MRGFRVSLLVVVCVFLSACGTMVRVVDSAGKPISDAVVKSQQFSIGGWMDCGKTNRNGKRRVWPAIPDIESIMVTKEGYVESQINVFGHDDVTFVLTPDIECRTWTCTLCALPTLTVDNVPQ